ncbi:MAG: hypothetical protein CVU18_11075 [Betaproteobacteria bacterium HGW-Betaproteobacteria-12]|nr:MAG: hypothetical protein CVU18_11075 [Betaproteobacteria bacterium HGW-Betaproteobacteria-12]
MNTIQKALAIASLGVFSLTAQAATCTNDSFVITTMTSSVDATSVLLPPGGIQSTSCYGVIAGNDAQGGTLEPNPNLGYLNDGLLNGEGGKISPTQFISASQLQGLENPNNLVDPGWIMLGTLGGNSGELNYYDKPLDISKLLTFEMFENANGIGGTWSLTTVPNIVQILNDAGIFDRNYFDHLAFVVKAGSGPSDGGWAVYDFDFNILLAAFPGAFDLTTPYSFTGTWNMNDFGDKDISHMSVWARDPISANSVPVPGTVLLLGLGLVALGFARRK